MDWIDTNGDGMVDVYGMDNDGDGYAEQIAVDTDGDAVLDSWAVDSNLDGHAETTVVDADGNGLLDTLRIDTDGNGVHDLFVTDVNGDTVSDVWLVDSNENGYIETSASIDANGVFSNVLNDLDENGVIDSVGPSTSTSTSPTPDGYEYQVPTNGPTFIDAISQPENPFLSDQSADDPFGDTSGPYSSTTYDSDGDLVNDAFDRNPTADEEGYFRSESSRYPDEDG